MGCNIARIFHAFKNQLSLAQFIMTPQPTKLPQGCKSRWSHTFVDFSVKSGKIKYPARGWEIFLEVSTLAKHPFVIVKDESGVVRLTDEINEVFGTVKEITSRALGAEGANLAEVTLFGPDVTHYHKKNEETYISKADGEIFINEEIHDFSAGTRVIIAPGTLHAARPKGVGENLTFLCVSGPPFDPEDVFNDSRGRNR